MSSYYRLTKYTCTDLDTCSRIGRECSSLFIVVIGLVFVFSLWCIDWVGGRYANRIFMCFYIGGDVGTRGGVGWLWGCFGPPPPPPRWFALLAVLGRWPRCWSYSLLLCGLFYEAICCVSFHVSFCSCVFSPLPLRVREGLRFVLVAFPGFIPYPFLNSQMFKDSFHFFQRCTVMTMSMW